MEDDTDTEEPGVRGYTIRTNSSSATIHLFGATLISWIANGRDMLFFSKKSLFTVDDIVTGGVPLIFPQFGPWNEAPEHGFARVTTWKLNSKKKDSITLVLQDSPATRLYWDHKFHFEYTLALIDDSHMKIDITITNLGEDPFSFAFLLHNYLSVHDILRCRVNGLKGCRYVDKVKNGEQNIEDREDIAITGYTNRVYYNTRVIHRIKNVSPARDIVLEKMNLPDTVIWNPWIEKAKMMPDFDDDEWKIMLCVASGYFNSVLEPKKQFVASQIMSVESS